MFSCAGNVMDDGNSLLADNHLEKITLLRMNRTFMEFMRAHYNHISQQEFQRTVVRADDAEVPAPSTPLPAAARATGAECGNEWETPATLDAIEPRLVEEPDDTSLPAGLPAGAGPVGH